MPLALWIALILGGAMFILMNAGLSELRAFGLVLGGIVFIQLITMCLLMLIVKDKQKLKESLQTEFQKCIDEIKVFLNIKSN